VLAARGGGFPVILLAFAAIAILGGIFGWKAHQKRLLALEAWARATGLDYRRDKDEGLTSRFAQFSCFSSGSRRYAQNVMSGTRGERRVYCFDHHYETYSTNSKGQRTTHHHWSSNIVFDVGFPLSPLTIRSESWFDKVAGAFGFDDIDFESNEFSREFHVKAKDRRWAYDVIQTKVMEILLASPRFVVEMAGTHLLVRRGSRFGAEQYGQALVLGSALLDALPADIVRERRGLAGRS
jgi:hypothetical protein